MPIISMASISTAAPPDRAVREFNDVSTSCSAKCSKLISQRKALRTRWQCADGFDDCRAFVLYPLARHFPAAQGSVALNGREYEPSQRYLGCRPRYY